MESLDITNIQNLYASSRNIPISLKLICNNILESRWQFESSDKIININKTYIESLVFSICRDIPIINIKLLDYKDNESRKLVILNSEKELLNLLFYFKGLTCNEEKNINYLLNCLKNNTLKDFETENFNFKLHGNTTSLNFKDLPLDVQSIILNRETLVSICTINDSSNENVKFAKSILMNN